MTRRRFLKGIGSIPLVASPFGVTGGEAQERRFKGPLRIHPKNPRYFTDDGKRAIYLTGSHTWSDLQDMGPSDPPPAFDFNAYLDFLVKHNHNFIRLWRWEVPRYRYSQGALSFCEPHPWLRTGPGTARDGKPKFDLTKFNEAYFKRLRQRVEAAAKRGIFVSVMLFEGHCLQFADEGREFHPFHTDNNINGIGWKDWREYYTLGNPKVLELQEAYVRKVIDTLNDLDNVLYEVCNEAGGYSTEWQYHMIRFVKSYEARKRKRHAVGMTFQYQGGTNENLFNSPADWISPNPEGGYRDDPPPNDGRKIVLNDTDHLWGEGGNPQWVWKTFTRGHHPLFMDRLATLTAKVVTWAGRKAEDIPGAEEIRKASCFYVHDFPPATGFLDPKGLSLFSVGENEFHSHFPITQRRLLGRPNSDVFNWGNHLPQIGAKFFLTQLFRDLFQPFPPVVRKARKVTFNVSFPTRLYHSPNDEIRTFRMGRWWSGMGLRPPDNSTQDRNRENQREQIFPVENEHFIIASAFSLAKIILLLAASVA